MAAEGITFDSNFAIMRTYSQFFLLLFITIPSFVSAQGVALSSSSISTPDGSSLLDIQSTTKGLLVPRIALTGTTSATPLTLPATSLLVYNTATVSDVSPGYYYNSGTGASPNWTRLLAGNINLTSQVTGVLPIANGGTNSSTQNWVDLSTNQTAAGNKTWSGIGTLSNVTPVRTSDGTALLPAYAFTNDAAIGMWRAGTNILALSTAGVERLRILANGNIGIGAITAPTALFDIAGNAFTTASVANISANGLTTGNGMSISSTTTAGDNSALIRLTRSGTNGSTAKQNYGIYSAITNTQATSGTNIAGYFSASSANATSNYINTGVYGTTSNIYGDGVIGYNSAASGAGYGSGVFGYSAQNGGAGVWGDGGTNSGGVYGTAVDKHVWNSGVYGENYNNTSGSSWAYDQVTAGVAGVSWGTASFGTGLYGYNSNSTVNNNAGVFAQDGQGYISGLTFTYTPGATQRTLGAYGRGVGVTNDRAIQGEWSTVSTDPWGFIGDATTGVYGSSGTVAAGRGVWGNASSTTGYGGYFNNTATGLYATTSTPASYYGIYCAAGGGLANGNTWANSDARYKTNIVPMSNGILDKIMQLNPCNYNFDVNKFPVFRGNEGNQIGLIAQELEQVFPELVNNQKYIPDPTVDPNGKETPAMVKGYYAVDYSSLTPILIKGMQEQQAMIAQLQQTIKVYDEGKSKLSNGKVRVDFDASFRELIGNNPPVVTISPMGQCNGIYISAIDSKGFEVTELNNGNSNAEFSFILIGKNSNSAVAKLPNPVVGRNVNGSQLVYDNSAVSKLNKSQEEK